MLKDLLEAKNCFKLVCGAGNEDAKEVEKLVAVYAKAGCRFFDLSASEEIIDAAKRGLEFANVDDAYLCVSVGIKNDPHVNKAVVDYEKCISCYSCDSVCPQGAIKFAKVKKYKCIGCGRCAKICPKGAISYVSEEKDLREVLPTLIEKGIDCIEFHAMGLNDDEIWQKWNYINEIYPGILSLCTSRGKLSDEKLVERVKKLTSVRASYTTIVQADGFPMSGGKDDFKTTLQAVATAEIIQNENLPVYLLLSGGTNSKTAELAKMCGINANGISVGSFARKIVKKYNDREDFLRNELVFNDAVNVAKELISKSNMQN